MILKTAYKMKPPPSVRLVSGHPLADKLIACYLLQEGSGFKAFDASGRRHTGTLAPGAWRATGKFGRTINLDGTFGYVEIADHPDFTPTLTPLSISAWIYMRDASSFPIASKNDSVDNHEWVFYVDEADKPAFYVYDNTAGGYRGRFYDTAITGYEDTWVHLAATYDGGRLSAGIKLYLNSLRVDDTNDESGLFLICRNTAAPVYMGKYKDNVANGLFDNVMFWRRVLTESDVTLLYRRPACMFERSGRPQLCAAGVAI